MKHTAEPWKIEKVTGWQGNTVYCRITSEHFAHPGGIAYASIPLTGRTKKQKELAGVYKSQGDALCQYNAKRIIDCVNALAGIENPQEFCDNRSVIINNLIEDKRKLKEAGANLLEAMNQYSFFLDGYRAGSASISECNHANDELNKAQNALFELLKTQ